MGKDSILTVSSEFPWWGTSVTGVSEPTASQDWSELSQEARRHELSPAGVLCAQYFLED